MVKVTNKYLIRKLNSNKQYSVRKKNETDKQFLNRITHLYLQSQFIDHIAKVTVCHSVTVIYLQNNVLRSLQNIDSFSNLTYLYLQRNFLNKIDHLDSLQRLKKIYLGFNEIRVLEGFINLPNVKEIHMECQDLNIAETIFFEPQTIQNLATSLEVLNISQNNLTSLNELKYLLRIQILIANDNLLTDLSDIIRTLKEWPFLKRLTLCGNPVTRDRSYSDGIIFACKSLEVLDNKSIQENTRKFIEKLTERRKCLIRREEAKLTFDRERRENKSVTFVQDSTQTKNIFSSQKMSAVVPHFSHPAWQLRRNINPVNPTTFLPLPYWKKGGIHNLRNKCGEKTKLPEKHWLS